MSSMLALSLCCFTSLLWSVNGFATGTVADNDFQCGNMRVNFGAGDFTNHGAEDDVDIDSGIYGIKVNITEQSNGPLDRHNFFNIRVELLNDTSPGLIGWMVQIRDNGSSNALPAAVGNGTIRGSVWGYNSSISEGWQCPSRWADVPRVPAELDNGLKWKDSSLLVDPNFPKVTDLDFTWAPVQKNGTNPDNSVNYISDIPKCGKVVFTLMYNQKSDSDPSSIKYTWVHVRESACFVSFTQPGTPIPCEFDADCQ